ncbi:beta-1,3-galactosyltransferase 1-like isoform X1 [Antennarius striatus]|uniref:beta-1,3-galactosyltransferase 1-like isoform X1 n=1 Tax=Antennarius striatus TaxID=241820 RepID=UPI0035AD7C57
MGDEEAGLCGQVLNKCVDPSSQQKKPLFYSLFQLLLLLCLFFGILGYSMISSSIWQSIPLHHQSQRSFQWISQVGQDNPELEEETKKFLKTTAKPIVPASAPPEGIQYHEGYPTNYRFLIDHKDVCKTNNPFLVLITPAAPKNVRARNVIRQTWGNETLVQDKVVVHLFVLGLPGGSDAEEVQKSLNEENLQHQDLIQSNFVDTYHNLTIKTMVLMHWLATRCPKAAYVMKIDTDMLLSVENLLTMLQRPNIPKTNYLTGYIMRNIPVVRSMNSKWYVSEEMYPENTYPPYPLGTAYLLSNDLPAKFVEISKSVNYCTVEDAYIGMCMKKLELSILQPPDPSQFRVYHFKYNRCQFSKFITYNVISPDELEKFWTDLKRPEPPCPEKKPEDASNEKNNKD